MGRALSRLLKAGWPKTLEELEALRPVDPPGDRQSEAGARGGPKPCR